VDSLLEIHQPLKRAVFGRVAEVLDLEVDGSRGARTLISR
jgi:hypothetical protein